MPFFWLLCAGLTAWIASRKGRNPILWFVIGLFGNLVALIIVALLPRPGITPPTRPSSGWENLSSAPKPQPSSEDVIDVPYREVRTKNCPACGALVSEDANFCENCGKKLKFRFSFEKKSDHLSASAKRCAKCGELMPKNAVFCANCGNKA